jgi:hypothetical protein
MRIELHVLRKINSIDKIGKKCELFQFFSKRLNCDFGIKKLNCDFDINLQK